MVSLLAARKSSYVDYQWFNNSILIFDIQDLMYDVDWLRWNYVYGGLTGVDFIEACEKKSTQTNELFFIAVDDVHFF